MVKRNNSIYNKNLITTEIIKKAKEGDKYCRELIINAYYPLCISLIRKYHNIYSHTDEDLLQHCNLSILNAIYKFRLDGCFPLYIKRTLSNNLALLCKKNPSDNAPVSLNSYAKDCDCEIIDLIPDDNILIEDLFIQEFSENTILSAIKYLDFEEKRLCKFLISTDLKCPLKRYSEIYNIPYHKCRYTKKKISLKLKNILNNLSK